MKAKLYSIHFALRALLASVVLAGIPCGAAPGDVDLSFDPGSSVDDNVYAIAVQPDGKLLIGGYFSTVKGLVRSRIARLNPDGSGDDTFNAGAGIISSLSFPGEVDALR